VDTCIITIWSGHENTPATANLAPLYRKPVSGCQPKGNNPGLHDQIRNISACLEIKPVKKRTRKKLVQAVMIIGLIGPGHISGKLIQAAAVMYCDPVRPF